ncbi:MAG: phage tail spike protein, partial [Bacillota bacterium]|nr:phage tail spike protein [Bacillota bacterium]
MGSVYVYDAEGLDTSTTGLCGELVPVHCEHEELAGGLSTVTMQHPFDEWGKWQHLEVGNLLKCDVRCRTAPAIDENDLLITSVERWTVRTTLTSTQRRVFKSKKGSKKNGSLIMGREVFVLQQVTTGSLTRWQIKFEVQRKRKKKIIYTWKTGWIENKDNILDTKLEDVTTPGGDMEAVCPSVETAPQLFRINRIEKDAERGVSVTAEHVSYDLKYNVTRFNYTGQLTGLQCLKGGTATIGGQTVTVDDGIMGSLDFDTEVEAYTNIGSVRVAADYINVNPTAALLDPKTGFLAKYGAELIRDDWTMYFVTRAGRDNGMRIEYGKNLTGVQFEVSEEDLYTAVLPLGVNKNGSVLYLADDSNPGSISNYVLSEHAALYPFMRVKVLECDATVEKTKKGVTLAVARARMLAEAQAQFAADNPGRIDVPEMSARVNFVELGDTVEYEKYKGLESVFLYDTVTVADAPHGIEIKAEVQETRWDVLEERMIEIVVGNVSPGNVWSWAVERVEAPEPEPVVWV